MLIFSNFIMRLLFCGMDLYILVR